MSSAAQEHRIALWLIGARGNVASTVALGLASLQSGAAGNVGLTTEIAPLDQLPLADFGQFVLGGHDLRLESVVDVAERLGRHDRTVDPGLIEKARAFLESYEGEIAQGSACATDWKRLSQDIRAFRESKGCSQLVVVNLSSTEAVADAVPTSETSLLEALEQDRLPMSCAYAMAALDAGGNYLNFTPSTGASFELFDRLFAERGLVHAGRDGKTGETLLKSALLPMFASRNLQVLSWFGQNILGNGDGATLRDPASKSAKQTSKGGLVPGILGYEPEAHVGIDYVGPLGDWKVAWDHIQFAGFLGTEMNLQLTWRGADSILAAPLVIDLARIAAYCQGRGDRGLLPKLGFYFKDPLGSSEHRLAAQYEELLHFLAEGESA